MSKQRRKYQRLQLQKSMTQFFTWWPRSLCFASAWMTLVFLC